MPEILQFINNVPQTNRVLNGYYEIQKKQDRNGKFLAKYWALCEFTAFHMPEGTKIEIDLSNCTKEMMSEIVKSIRGVESISYAKMSEEQFEKHYSDMLDECCKLLRLAPETVINDLVGFM